MSKRTITGWVPEQIAAAMFEGPVWLDGYSSAIGHHAVTAEPLAGHLRYMTVKRDEQTCYDREGAVRVTITIGCREERW